MNLEHFGKLVAEVAKEKLRIGSRPTALYIDAGKLEKIQTEAHTPVVKGIVHGMFRYSERINISRVRIV